MHYVCNDHHRNTSVTWLHKKLGWENLAQMLMVVRLIMVYKIVIEKVAISEEEFFKYQTKTRASYNQQLQQYKPRRDIDKFAFA